MNNMTKVPFLDLQAQHQPLRAEIDRAIAAVIDSGAFAGGPFVEKFEKEFAEYCGAPFALGLGNGTDALWFALLALGIGPGDEVITVPSTFMATAEAISYCGARPVFVDVDERTYTMHPAGLEAARTAKTKAVIPVHLFGQCADMDPILAFARKHGLHVIEDAAQAHGAKYKGRSAGTMGDAGCFSFYPGKNLGAFGEAGAVITGDAAVRDRIRMLRDHGQERKYQHAMIGWNGRMDGIQAAVLSIKLRHLEAGNTRRRTRAAEYDGALAALDEIVTPFVAPYAHHVYHIYAVRLAERDQLIASLGEEGIHCGIHYPIPIHLQEAYRHLGYNEGDFPVAERIAREFVSLPMFPDLSAEQVSAVVSAIKNARIAEAVA
jgi:dTDP-4-amino-4,6-dideoxygalactose transaminase